MVQYTVDEYVDMHLIYGECRCNASAAERLYAERYPDRAHPNRSTIQSVDQRLRDHNCVMPYIVGMQVGRTIDTRIEERILKEKRKNPNSSARSIAKIVRVNTTTVAKILRNE